MKRDIATAPFAAGRLGADGVVFAPDGVPDLVEQFWGRGVHLDLLALKGSTCVDTGFNLSAINANNILESLIFNYFSIASRRFATVRPKPLDRNFRANPTRLECLTD